MRPPEYISPQQLIAVIDPRPVERGTWKATQNALSPFSPPSRTTSKDLASCAEIVETVKSLNYPPYKFNASYEGAVAVDGITFAWDGTQTVIRDDSSPDDTEFLQNLPSLVREQPSRPSETDTPRAFGFFSRKVGLEGTPITHSVAQKVGRVATAATTGVIGFGAVETGLSVAELQVLSESDISAYGGIFAAVCVIASLRIQRRRERNKLVAQAKAQVLGLDERIHNPDGGIVFPRNTSHVNIGADKNQTWQGIYEGEVLQGKTTTHTVNPVMMIYTALKQDNNPKEFWEQPIGDKSLRDYSSELADLCQRKHLAATELTSLKRLAKDTGSTVLPADIVTRQKELERYQSQMDELAGRITELIIIRKEQQRYIQDSAARFQSILTTSEQNQAAIERFGSCTPPQNSPVVVELLLVREKLSQAINTDIFLPLPGAETKSKAHTLNRLAKYMERHEPAVEDAAGFNIYYRALHDKFVGELPSLSALFGLPAPNKSAKEVAVDESKELASLFGAETKVTVLDGLVYATTETNLTIYESVASARQAATQEESGQGIRIDKKPRIITSVHIPADKLDDLGIAEDRLLQLFGKDDGRNSAWISYAAHNIITRMLRKADDAQLLWANGFGESVKALAACYDACQAEGYSSQRGSKNYDAIFPLGLAVVRDYLAYVRPETASLA